MPQALSEQDLIGAIVEADEEGMAAGEDVRQRAGLMTLMRAMTKLGFDGVPFGGPGTPPAVIRLGELLKHFYQREDYQAGGMHMGAILFRDTFARVNVPIIFGQTAIDPLRHVELPPIQLMLMKSRGEYWRPYADQFTDLFDFGWGIDELGRSRPLNALTTTFFGLAHFQIQAAGATVTGAYDFRGAVQSALLGAELSLKAGLAAHGLSQAELAKRDLGHNLVALTERLAAFEPEFEASRVLSVVSKFPPYVANRYDPKQPDRHELGAIIMGAQYVAAEVMRRFTDRDFRSARTPPLERVYPPGPTP